MNSLKNVWGQPASDLSRRELFRRGGLLALLSGILRGHEAVAAPAPAVAEIYQALGVRPLINCRGTFTIIGGSLELPEVRAAKEAAALHYVHLDELMEAVGRRLAELTGAEAGIVTSGCAAALAHATAACVAGANPDKHVRIPNLSGFAKDEVIIPKHSRNVYDAAVRSVGVRVLEAGTPEEFEAALGPRTAMVYVLAGPPAETGPMALEVLTGLARQKNVPVLVDAAAEILTVPNVHLQKGAALVGYSGGKCLRGPQCAGLLLGRKDLVRSAWVHSAPHHGFGRSMKIGKEEVMGMLAAVEMWMKRDHKAEWNQWLSWMDHIAKRVSTVEGVTATVRSELGGLSNRSPGLNIRWDGAKLGITGAELAGILYNTEPRITLNAVGGNRGRGAASSGETGVSITAYMMSPGEEKVVAERLHALLSNPPRTKPKQPPRAPAADLSGQWDVRIEYIGSTSDHTLHLRQQDGYIMGSHQGDYVSRELYGTIEGDAVRLSSSWTEEHGDNLSYEFVGTVQGDTLSGTLDLGEYLTAKWSAKRHEYRRAAPGPGAQKE
ncbi:MAG TPA: aminotransferase class V-fold PLP-dependent enzyme [Blastocatellia bacterium]|nr:aminotransferase class V-fold PLP-dependent enzyme [Blastocatellia bacterium]